jgi:hypothetical protein
MDTTTLTTAIFFAHYHRSCVRSLGFSYHIDHRPVTALGSRDCMVHSSRNGIRYFGFVSVLDVCKYLRKYNVLQKKTKSQKKRIVIYCVCHWKPSGIICEVMVWDDANTWSFVHHGCGSLSSLDYKYHTDRGRWLFGFIILREYIFCGIHQFRWFNMDMMQWVRCTGL